MGLPNESVEGFGNDDESEGVDEGFKSRKTGKKCGGFQGMGLSYPVLKGIQKRGYKIPTPIQRKTIPLVVEGRDVVAMARTGSGKTACFLIPLFEKLKARSAKTGARALILSPTRELALQTNRFIKELGRFLDLKSTVILGGDSMDTQFDALHGNPDIIVATPGRFLHVCVEMDLKLTAIEYVVFDEADRLFEMGFGEQLHEILARLPDSRQTLLFSATLPKMLVEFARAGLADPVLLRLDVDSKIPDTLKLGFISCCSEEKPAALLALLRHVMPEGGQTAVFVPTKHHVDYIYMLLCRAGFSASYIYSDLDPSARKINAAKFVTGKCQVLVVTDVAARGVDIPCLDMVVNYNFPPKPKLFVHRVGRCARAGRSGVAYSLVTPEERPYLLDLHLFLGRPIVLVPKEGITPAVENDRWKFGSVGRVPREILEEEDVQLIQWHENTPELVSMKKVCQNAYSQYLRSRPGASNDSVKRSKEAGLGEVGEHPGFFRVTGQSGIAGKGHSSIVDFAESATKSAFLDQVRSYRPSGTVFETGPQSNPSLVAIMREKRQKHDDVVIKHRQKVKEGRLKGESSLIPGITRELPESNEEEIQQAFKHVVAPKRKLKDKGKAEKRSRIDKQHYIPYTAPDHHTEQGLAINSFDKDAARFELELGADSEVGLNLKKKIMKWDQKKKKMVSVQENNKIKKIRTESGVWIPATYKSGRYNEWKEKSKIGEEEDEDDDDGNEVRGFPSGVGRGRGGRGRHQRGGRGAGRSEMKRPEQILKERKVKEAKKKRSMKKGGQRGRGARGGSRGRSKGRA
ncbi:ATP-dependent RNA helicase DDX54 [Ischnura elegans]|uniref:ATP-dependent RNA helicase DDX54 n=1 Tax=Ischnura elegans TaxID=197161 RepID=UPI001ED893DE|nr:ATP-dependent RNA helicase DDX54 [Ischnura elegans]